VRSRYAALAIACVAVACGAISQPEFGWNEASHYAQVVAFASGTPIIDRYQRATGDKARFHGHYYSDKAPGLALATLPLYEALRLTGAVHTPRSYRLVGNSKRQSLVMLRILLLLGCVIPAALLLWLTTRYVEPRQRGLGTLTAVSVGIATLLLPFSTLFFSHVLAACLGFAAYCFVVIARERDGDPRFLLAAGLAAGFGIATEYPVALLAGILGVTLLWSPSRLRGGLAYTAGLLVGITPLLLYDTWAFGSPTTVSYQYVAANSAGVLGFDGFSLHRALTVLFGTHGLFIGSPVLAAAVAGTVLLFRSGRRWEALTIGVIGFSYLLYNATYYLPFGGAVLGPRFLISAIPFLALPLAYAYRRALAATLALAVISAVYMTSHTLARHQSWPELLNGHFARGIGPVLVFIALMVAAVVLTARATGRVPRDTRGLVLGAAAIAAWGIISRSGATLLGVDIHTGDYWGAAALLVLVVDIALVTYCLASKSRLTWAAGVPLLVFLDPAFSHHVRWSLLFGSATLALLLAITVRTGRHLDAPGVQRAALGG
jgi:hypothetical protein